MTELSHAEDSDRKLSITFSPPQMDPQLGHLFGDRWYIYLDGPIEKGAAERFNEEVVRRKIDSALVFMNSPGGSLLEGIAIGRAIRRHGFSTYIGKQNTVGKNSLPGECMSACVLAYIGGRFRYYRSVSTIGVHRFSSPLSTDADLDIAQIVSAAITNYIREMGVDVGLFERMSRAGKAQLLILTPTELDQLSVTNNGRQSAEWTIEAVKGVVYLRGAQRTSVGMGKAIFFCSKNNGEVIFWPQYFAGDNAKHIVDAVVRHSIRFDEDLVPLGTPMTPMIINNDWISAVFILGPDHLTRLRNSSSIGYAAHPRNPVLFAGFTVDTAGSMEKIRGFLETCKR